MLEVISQAPAIPENPWLQQEEEEKEEAKVELLLLPPGDVNQAWGVMASLD